MSAEDGMGREKMADLMESEVTQRLLYKPKPYYQLA